MTDTQHSYLGCADAGEDHIHNRPDRLVAATLSPDERYLTVKVGPSLEGQARVYPNGIIHLSEILVASTLGTIRRCIQADLDAATNGVIYQKAQQAIAGKKVAGIPLRITSPITPSLAQ